VKKPRLPWGDPHFPVAGGIFRLFVRKGGKTENPAGGRGRGAAPPAEPQFKKSGEKYENSWYSVVQRNPPWPVSDRPGPLHTTSPRDHAHVETRSTRPTGPARDQPLHLSRRPGGAGPVVPV